MVVQGQRKIPVQYAKRVVGNKVMGGQSSFLPLKAMAGGKPTPLALIASLALAAALGQFMSKGNYNIYGDPTTMSQMYPQYTQGMGFSNKLDGLLTTGGPASAAPHRPGRPPDGPDA